MFKNSWGVYCVCYAHKLKVFGWSLQLKWKTADSEGDQGRIQGNIIVTAIYDHDFYLRHINFTIPSNILFHTIALAAIKFVCYILHMKRFLMMHFAQFASLKCGVVGGILNQATLFSISTFGLDFRLIYTKFYFNYHLCFLKIN